MPLAGLNGSRDRKRDVASRTKHEAPWEEHVEQEVSDSDHLVGNPRGGVDIADSRAL